MAPTQTFRYFWGNEDRVPLLLRAANTARAQFALVGFKAFEVLLTKSYGAYLSGREIWIRISQDLFIPIYRIVFAKNYHASSRVFHSMMCHCKEEKDLDTAEFATQSRARSWAKSNLGLPQGDSVGGCLIAPQYAPLYSDIVWIGHQPRNISQSLAFPVSKAANRSAMQEAANILTLQNQRKSHVLERGRILNFKNPRMFWQDHSKTPETRCAPLYLIQGLFREIETWRIKCLYLKT